MMSRTAALKHGRGRSIIDELKAKGITVLAKNRRTLAEEMPVTETLELLEELQGTSFEGVARTIDVHIRNLRTKIEPEPSSPRYIETVFGVGYRFQSVTNHPKR